METVYISKLMIYNGLILLQCQDHVSETIRSLLVRTGCSLPRLFMWFGLSLELTFQ
jgi:hypothetical protein